MKLKRNLILKHKELDNRFVQLIRNTKMEPYIWTCKVLSTGKKHKIHAIELVNNYAC